MPRVTRSHAAHKSFHSDMEGTPYGVLASFTGDGEENDGDAVRGGNTIAGRSRTYIFSELVS